MFLFRGAPGGALAFPGVTPAAIVIFHVTVSIVRNSKALAKAFFNLIFQLCE